ncbi:MAG: hypothetical protein V2I33_26425 [Kangiellaceae bacterium]|jgi:hypothetical protein|nr:hypothetical protein [Kangiellaceae bacterium]
MKRKRRKRKLHRQMLPLLTNLKHKTLPQLEMLHQQNNSNQWVSNRCLIPFITIEVARIILEICDILETKRTLSANQQPWIQTFLVKNVQLVTLQYTN